MRLELTGRQITITPALRIMVEERLAHVQRLLNQRAVSAQVVLTKEKARVHADVTLHARGEHFMHSAAGGRDAQAALGAAADKIERQAQKLKGKLTEGKRRGVSAAKAATAVLEADLGGRAAANERRAAARASGLRLEGDVSPRVIRSRRYAMRSMSIEAAAAVVSDGSDGVIVFRNSVSKAVAVMFRRPDGNIGLIEPEA